MIAMTTSSSIRVKARWREFEFNVVFCIVFIAINVAQTTGLPGTFNCLRLRVNLTSYWNERKAPETGVVPISSGYTLGFWRGREEGCQAQFL
jgi:hypothetical protein